MKNSVACLASLAALLLLAIGTVDAAIRPAPSKLQPPVPISVHVFSKPAGVCDLLNHNDTADTFFDSFITGDRIATYIDPAICDTPQYPYEIEGVWLTMYSAFGGLWPVQVAVEVWTPATGNACGGPGNLIHTDTLTLDSTSFKEPKVGTVAFSKPICVTGPFFIAVRYTGATPTPYPSILFDTQRPGDSCGNWGYTVGFSWNKWNNYWAQPLPGNPIIWVLGQTQSTFCNSAACCNGTVGNIDGVGIIDLVDLSSLVNYLTGGGFILPCPAAANVNGIGIVDLADLSSLVNYLLGGGITLQSCQ